MMDLAREQMILPVDMRFLVSGGSVGRDQVAGYGRVTWLFWMAWGNACGEERRGKLVES